MDENEELIKNVAEIIPMATPAFELVRITDLDNPVGENVAERLVENGRPMIRIAGRYLFFDVEFNTADEMDLLAVDNMVDKWLDLSNNALLSGNAEEYVFHVEMLGVGEDRQTYGITFFNPAFYVKDGSILRFSFDVDTVNLYRHPVDYTEMMGIGRADSE